MQFTTKSEENSAQIYRLIISSIVKPKLFFGLSSGLLFVFGICSATVIDAVGNFCDRSSIGAADIGCVLSVSAADGSAVWHCMCALKLVRWLNVWLQIGHL